MFFPVYYSLDVGSVALLGFAAGYKALRQGMPVAGAVILGAVAGVAGVMLRDVLLSFAAVSPLHDPYYAACAFGGAFLGALMGIAAGQKTSRLYPACLFYADSLGLALITTMAASRAEVVGIQPVGCVLMGLLVGCTPSVLRDLCLGDVPQAFEEQFYATASLVGAMATVGLGFFIVPGSLQVLASAGVVVLLRLWGQKNATTY